MSVFEQYKRISARITDDQRDLLDFIWQEYLKTSEWPRITNVICEIGSPRKVDEWLKELGEAIVTEIHGREGKKVLRLTFLGSLLTSSCTDSIEILRKFLIHLKMQILDRGDIEFTLERSHLVEALQTNEAQERLLLRLSDASGHYWGAFNGTDAEWYFQPWDEAVKLFDIQIQDMNKYILSVAIPDQYQEAEFQDAIVESDSIEIPDDFPGIGDVVLNDNLKGKFKYDVALSFAGEQRSYVEEVNDYLKSNGVRTFYDYDQKVELWGTNLTDNFDEIFRISSRYCVMFISKEYKEKSWTNHERKSALARGLEERREYVLPARFDDTDLPGLIPTIHYIELSNLSPEQFARMIIRKIEYSEKSTEADIPTTSAVGEELSSDDEGDSISELVGLLLTLKQYAEEAAKRDMQPGSTQLKEAFEIGCDEIRSVLKEAYFSDNQISSELHELSLFAEEIGVYEFNMGRESYEEFMNLIQKALSHIDIILGNTIQEVLKNDSFQAELKDSFEDLISDINEVLVRIESLNQEQLYKRILKYQSETSELGMRIYRIGYLMTKISDNDLGNGVMQIGIEVHLIETTYSELDPEPVFSKFNDLKKYVTDLSKFEKGFS